MSSNHKQQLTAIIQQTLKSGFTLVEMLVVIAIISILAAMLMPTLIKAREAANTVTCTGQMRQLSHASSAYTMDYNGWIMPSRYKSLVFGYTSPIYWQSYVIGDASARVRGYNNKYIEGNALYCPSSRGNLPESERYWSYVINSNICPYDVPKARITRLKNPAQKVQFGDNNIIMRIGYSIFNYKNQLGFPHIGKANLCFFDGHVESRMEFQIDDRNYNGVKNNLDYEE